MKVSHLERAAYIAAHAILAADVSAPELACPGARRSYTVDAIADIIRRTFELANSERDWRGQPGVKPTRHSRIVNDPARENILPFPAESAVQKLRGVGAS